MEDILKQEICFLPLDVPPLPDKNLISDAFQKLESEAYIWWNREILLGESNYEDPLGSYKCHWSEQAKQLFPSIVESIESHLPFENLFYVHLASAKETILPHVDENYVEKPFPFHMTILPELKQHLEKHEPVGFRFLIEGQRDALYLCSDYDPEYKTPPKQSKTHCQLPEDTDFFLIRNSKVPHGVDIDPKVFRLMGFALGSVQPDAHRNLIEKSLIKYESYCIRAKDIKK